MFKKGQTSNGVNKEIKKRKIKISRAKIILYAIGFGFLILAAILTAGFFALAFSNADKILYGVSVAGENLGRLSPQSAEQTLGRKIADWRAKKIKFKYKDKTWEAAPEEIGVSIDAKKTIGKAYGVGRSKDVLKSATDQITSAFFGKNIALETATDEKQLKDFYERSFGKIEREIKDASLGYNQDTGLFEIVKEQNGYRLDENKMRADFFENAARLGARNINIEMVEDIPLVSENGAVGAQKKANAILTRTPFTLVYLNPTSQNGSAKPREYRLDEDQLKDMLNFVKKDGSAELETRLKEDELKNFLIEISPSINQKPENAVLTMKNGKVTEFGLSKNGVELDIERNIAEIKNEMFDGANSIIALRSNVIQPEIRTDTIENLGLVSLLAVGESDFKGSPTSRVFNLTLAAKKLNGLIIKPGEEFSFVNAIGEISQKTGYRSGLVIKGNKTVPEYGGGVCQVSTTMFRAAIYAGLKITERYPHSLPVVYYNPQGFDATIYGPHPDLRFINDTPSNILIQTKVKGTKLYFEFYGSPDGRETKVIGPVEYDKKPDGSLKATLTREIYKDGELITTDVFKSNYRSPIKEPAQKNPLE